MTDKRRRRRRHEKEEEVGPAGSANRSSPEGEEEPNAVKRARFRDILQDGDESSSAPSIQGEESDSDGPDEASPDRQSQASTRDPADHEAADGEEPFDAVNLEGEEEEEGGVRGESLPIGEDLSVVKKRIKSTVHALSSDQWKKQSNRKISRSSLISQLSRDASVYYGYAPQLAEYFLSLFKPSEAIAFFEANETPRPLTLRTNTLKTRRRDLAKTLISRGANVDPLGDWTKIGLKVLESSVPMGATPEYCAGHYMIQSASSLIPVMALGPRPGEAILDMAAAPGGKSTHIGQLMRNTGVLFCNELRKDRCPALAANLHRLGVTNAIVINMDARELTGKLPPLDRVLLDAPCSGIGIIAKDQSVKVKRGPGEFKSLALLQKALLKTAVDLVISTPEQQQTDGLHKEGEAPGVIVYSTCSLSVEENEEVIDYILKSRDVKVVPLDLPDSSLGEPGLTTFRGKQFNPQIREARRLYPHLTNMDGFFICKLRKLSDRHLRTAKRERQKPSDKTQVRWGAEKWKTPLLDQIS